MKLPDWLNKVFIGIGAAIAAVIAIFVKSKLDEKKVNSAHTSLGKSEEVKKDIKTTTDKIDDRIDTIKKNTEDNKEVLKKTEEVKKDADKVSTNASVVVNDGKSLLEKKQEELAKRKADLEARKKALNGNT
jgi:hypothetical protein